MRACLVLMILSASCLSLTGCDLYSEIVTWMGKALSGYSNQSSVGIIVYPPFPESFFEAKNQPVKRAGFIFSDNVKTALMNGVNEYNRAGKQQVKAWHVTDEETVRALYNELDFGDPRDYLAKVIKDYRETDANQRDISAVVFGYFKDTDDNATKYNCTLGLYDYKTGNMGEVGGVVSKDAGRVQEKELENLMTSLLKKVYG